MSDNTTSTSSILSTPSASSSDSHNQRATVITFTVFVASFFVVCVIVGYITSSWRRKRMRNQEQLLIDHGKRLNNIEDSIKKDKEESPYDEISNKTEESNKTQEPAYADPADSLASLNEGTNGGDKHKQPFQSIKFRSLHESTNLQQQLAASLETEIKSTERPYLRVFIKSPIKAIEEDITKEEEGVFGDHDLSPDIDKSEIKPSTIISGNIASNCKQEIIRRR